MDVYKRKLNEYSNVFYELNDDAKKGKDVGRQMEDLLNEYTEFIIKCNKEKIWDYFTNDKSKKVFFTNYEIENLRRESIYCVWNMEKYKAKIIGNSSYRFSSYLENIKESVETECEHINIRDNSKVLFIGSGALPLSLIGISMYTNADCYGIDIDEDAVSLSRKVLKKFGKKERIDIYHSTFDKFSSLKEMTHIIFASTIEEKSDIIKELYWLTNDEVIIGVRYGNEFKSLFNYELGKIDERMWMEIDNIEMDNSIFDLAIYIKNKISFENNQRL